jgi:hypothetical protein
MDSQMVAAFTDEMLKISAASPAAAAGGNAAAPAGLKSGFGSNAMVSLSSGKSTLSSTPKTNPAKGNVEAKPTNYSIVHSEAPSAAFGSTSSTSKAVPPPPVRT